MILLLEIVYVRGVGVAFPDQQIECGLLFGTGGDEKSSQE